MHQPSIQKLAKSDMHPLSNLFNSQVNCICFLHSLPHVYSLYQYVNMVSYNPACYLPSTVSDYLPSAIACPPPPTLLQSVYNTFTSPFSTITTLKSAMDALLSLPFLSFLLIPTMTSYSTSLNILFFYLTWSTLVLSHSPLKVEIVASLAVRILFYILPSSLFLIFDIVFPSISESFKSLGRTALPMRNFTKNSKHLKTIGWSIFNILLSTATQATIEFILTSILSYRSALRVTTTLPLPWAIFKDVLRGLVLRDILTYIIHRYLLHSDSRTLALLHKKWYHTVVRVPYPLSPSYDHPMIYLLHTFLPIYLPAMFWRFHLITYIIYLTLISLEETFTHSGYAHLPTTFILGGIAKRNDAHCLTQEGNFGTWGLSDWIMGTGVGSEVLEDVIDEIMEKEEEEERLSRRVSRRVRGKGKTAIASKSQARSKSRGGRKSSSGGSGIETRKRRIPTRRRRGSDNDRDYEE